MYQEEVQKAQRLQIYLLKLLYAGISFTETMRIAVYIYIPLLDLVVQADHPET